MHVQVIQKLTKGIRNYRMHLNWKRWPWCSERINLFTAFFWVFVQDKIIITYWTFVTVSCIFILQSHKLESNWFDIFRMIILPSYVARATRLLYIFDPYTCDDVVSVEIMQIPLSMMTQKEQDQSIRCVYVWTYNKHVSTVSGQWIQT